MEIKKLNCEKMACPMPVIKTKQELEGIEKGALEVTVDNKTAKENLLKLAASLEMAVELKEEENLFKITFIKSTNIYRLYKANFSLFFLIYNLLKRNY